MPRGTPCQATRRYPERNGQREACLAAMRKGVMMEKKENGYATNRGGLIKAPKTVAAGDPKVTRTVAKKGDLRTGK